MLERMLQGMAKLGQPTGWGDIFRGIESNPWEEMHCFLFSNDGAHH